MNNADFLLTSGIVGAASAKVGLRSLLPGVSVLRRRRPVTDGEVADFMASLAPPDRAPAVEPTPAIAER